MALHLQPVAQVSQAAALQARYAAQRAEWRRQHQEAAVRWARARLVALGEPPPDGVDQRWLEARLEVVIAAQAASRLALHEAVDQQATVQETVDRLEALGQEVETAGYYHQLPQPDPLLVQGFVPQSAPLAQPLAPLPLTEELAPALGSTDAVGPA